MNVCRTQSSNLAGRLTSSGTRLLHISQPTRAHILIGPHTTRSVVCKSILLVCPDQQQSSQERR
jgi:hypothetical protein